MINATVNLSIIKNNALAVKKLIGKSKLCAVVKSDAYGHGMAKVAAALYNIADCFAVSTVDEGVTLRYSGIDKPILALMPARNTDRGVMFDIEMSVNSYREFLAVRNSSLKLAKRGKVHLKYNTGMNRFGLDSLEQLKRILNFAKNKEEVEIVGIYSHFFNAKDKDTSNAQFLKFAQPSKAVKDAFPTAVRHISASGGVLQKSAYFLDMVRVGLLLYGYKPFKSDKIDVTPAMTISSPIVGKRQLEANSAFLYGNYLTNKDLKLSIVDAGYADGLPFAYNGYINHSCMNVFGVEGEKSGSYIILGGERNAEKIADSIGTIPYDVLCSFTKNARYTYVD